MDCVTGFLSRFLHQKTPAEPDKETGSCLDPDLPGTGLQTEGDEGPGTPYCRVKGQLEPSRDGENMRIVGKSISDVLKEDQRPTE